MRQKVAIVGGGLTGLTAGLRLSQSGNKVFIFEKEKEWGGLAAGFSLGGKKIEQTYHHIFKTDKEIIKLVEDLGLSDKLDWGKSSVAQYYQGHFYPFVTAKDLLTFKPLGIIDKIRLGLVFLYLQKTADGKKLTKVGAAGWMRRWGGEKNYQVIWKPLLRGKFHQYYKEVSMAWLWARINVRGKSKDKDGTERLGYLRGGFGLMIEEMVKKIGQNGGVIRTNTEVEGIKNRREKVEIRVGGKNWLFDKVVACVPAGVFDRIRVPKGKELSQIPYLAFINIVFYSKQSLSKYYWHNISDTRSPFLVFIQHTNLVDKKNYENRHIYYLGAYVPQNHRYLRIEDKVVYKEFFDYLKKLWPEFDENLIEKKKIFRFNWAQHVAGKNYERMIPDYETGMKNVYFANFCQIFPQDRGMNYAIAEGEKVAKLVE